MANVYHAIIRVQPAVAAGRSPRAFPGGRAGHGAWTECPRHPGTGSSMWAGWVADSFPGQTPLQQHARQQGAGAGAAAEPAGAVEIQSAPGAGAPVRRAV